MREKGEDDRQRGLGVHSTTVNSTHAWLIISDAGISFEHIGQDRMPHRGKERERKIISLEIREREDERKSFSLKADAMLCDSATQKERER